MQTIYGRVIICRYRWRQISSWHSNIFLTIFKIRKYRDTITENAADITRDILGDKAEVIETDIIVDGGNVIKCDNAVIMVDKVIHANPHYSASKLLAELTRLFGCEVFLIPWDDEEGVYGHSDGVVRYLSDGDLLFTKYPDSKYIKQCQYMLKSHFNKMYNLWMPSSGAKCRERFQWAYINYIRTKDYIFTGTRQSVSTLQENVRLSKNSLVIL